MLLEGVGAIGLLLLVGCVIGTFCVLKSEGLSSVISILTIPLAITLTLRVMLSTPKGLSKEEVSIRKVLKFLMYGYPIVLRLISHDMYEVLVASRQEEDIIKQCQVVSRKRRNIVENAQRDISQLQFT